MSAPGAIEECAKKYDKMIKLTQILLLFAVITSGKAHYSLFRDIKSSPCAAEPNDLLKAISLYLAVGMSFVGGHPDNSCVRLMRDGQWHLDRRNNLG